MKKKAFTIVEILITAAIIVMMAIISVPAFSTYQKNSEWQGKISEIEGFIGEAGAIAKNPPQNVGGYEVKIGSSSPNTIELWEMASDFSTGTIIKTMRFVSGQSAVNPLVPGGNGNYAFKSCDAGGACSWDDNYSILRFLPTGNIEAVSWDRGNRTLLSPNFSVVFIEFQDTNFSPTKTVQLKVEGDPLRVIEVAP